MSNFLLAWNPLRWDWSELPNLIHRYNRSIECVERWSSSSNIKVGDRVFLIRLGEEPKGIFATGTVCRESYKALHWDSERAAKNELIPYVDFIIDYLLDPIKDKIISLADLQEAPLNSQHWPIQRSGAHLEENIAKIVYERLILLCNKQEIQLPDELSTQITYREGSVEHVTVNKYERNRNARIKCLEHYGYDCSVCGFNFDDKYGEIGKDFIHVHHVKLLSEIGKEYEVNPIEDLRPVCPNCHAIIHKKNPPYEIEQLRALIEK